MNTVGRKSGTLLRMQRFYRRHKALVTSPFITQEGIVDASLLDAIFRDLGLRADGGPVLDIGCGSGLLSTLFRARGVPYVGLDINVHPNFSGLQTGRVRFVNGSSVDLPFADARFGLVACVDSYEHYPDPVRAAAEMRRVLRPDGQVFLSVPNYSNVAGWVKRRMERSGAYARDTWAPFDFWKPQELEQFMTPERVRRSFESAGFSRFRVVGLARELHFGLLPWLLHPACPHKVKRSVEMFFTLFQNPVVKRKPGWSLHTLWAIA